MREYIVTITYQMMQGLSHLTKTCAISGNTMKEAKDYAKSLVNGEILNISAHKVKEGETVPELYYSWLYE